MEFNNYYQGIYICEGVLMIRSIKSRLRRYSIKEILNNDSYKLFEELQSKEQSSIEYNGNNTNLSYLFKIRADGHVSVGANDNSIYIENWDPSLNSTERVIQLKNQMNNKITMINADFIRDFVVSGDCDGGLMIQRISINKVLFKNSEFFENNDDAITCSSILDNYLCVGSNGYLIGIINLNNFTKIQNQIFEYDCEVTSLSIYRNEDQTFVIASGGKNNIYLLIYLCI